MDSIPVGKLGPERGQRQQDVGAALPFDLDGQAWMIVAQCLFEPLAIESMRRAIAFSRSIPYTRRFPGRLPTCVLSLPGRCCRMNSD
jgi:hypothetical protein